MTAARAFYAAAIAQKKSAARTDSRTGWAKGMAGTSSHGIEAGRLA